MSWLPHNQLAGSNPRLEPHWSNEHPVLSQRIELNLQSLLEVCQRTLVVSFGITNIAQGVVYGSKVGVVLPEGLLRGIMRANVCICL